MTMTDEYLKGYMQGAADAAARCIAVAASYDQEHPMIARMVMRLGELIRHAEIGEEMGG